MRLRLLIMHTFQRSQVLVCVLRLLPTPQIAKIMLPSKLPKHSYHSISLEHSSNSFTLVMQGLNRGVPGDAREVKLVTVTTLS